MQGRNRYDATRCNTITLSNERGEEFALKEREYAQQTHCKAPKHNVIQTTLLPSNQRDGEIAQTARAHDRQLSVYFFPCGFCHTSHVDIRTLHREPCHVYADEKRMLQGIMSHVGRSSVTRMNTSCHVHKWVTAPAHMWMTMGWLWVVGSLKLSVSFAKEPYKKDDILQKRPIILRSLLIVATPYMTRTTWGSHVTTRIV